MNYTYDFGDRWEHRIQLLDNAEPHIGVIMGLKDEQEVFCFGGEGHPCCEDCGSDPGWAELKVGSCGLDRETIC
jgi:hypothetical protein